jgi:cyclase
MQKITNNVYVENGFRGCNTSFVVTKQGVVVIDTPMVPSEAKKWRDEASKHGPIRYVINTEPHLDHVSGNCYFNGLVVGHEGTRQAILSASATEFKNMLQRMAPDSLPLDESFTFRPSDITLSQRLTLYLGEHTFHLINMSGHSPFQVAVYVPEEKVIFTSDNVTRGMTFFHQALPYEWLESLTQIEELDADILVPGHGNVCDKNFLPEMRAHVQAWIDAVLDAISKGMSSQEAQDKISLLNRYPGLPDDQRMTEIQRMNIAHLYEVLKKK